jgi:hypothetical protein
VNDRLTVVIHYCGAQFRILTDAIDAVGNGEQELFAKPAAPALVLNKCFVQILVRFSREQKFSSHADPGSAERFPPTLAPTRGAAQYELCADQALPSANVEMARSPALPRDRPIIPQ